MNVNKPLKRSSRLAGQAEKWEQSVKSYGVCYGVNEYNGNLITGYTVPMYIGILQRAMPVPHGGKLYLGLFTELGNPDEMSGGGLIRSSDDPTELRSNHEFLFSILIL